MLHVRQQVVDGNQEHEDGDQRHRDRQPIGDVRVRRESRRVALQQVEAERADEQADEEGHEREQHQPDGEQLAEQEGAVRLAVDDVEGRFEDAEERERRPEQRSAPDEAERGRVLLDRAHRVDDARDRAARERALQLGDQERRFAGPPGDGEEGDRQEEERYERKEREVGDHGREVRAAVAEELPQRLGQGRHGAEYGLC